MSTTTRLPAIFVGHGSPTNALEDNDYTSAWRAFGASIPRPKAILAVSAHWYIPTTLATGSEHPKTVHDFYNFPSEMYRIQYPAPGSPELANALQELVAPTWLGVDLDGWGFDHGTWSVLKHMYPEADVPVIQLSIDLTQPLNHHLEIGRRLAPLRDQGVLIFGSGNVVHNLGAFRLGHDPRLMKLARQFDGDVRHYLESGDDEALVEYELNPASRFAVPTPDHYLPLLTVAGTRQSGDALTYVVDDPISSPAVSMLSVQIG